MTAISATLRVRTEGALRSRAARGDAKAFAAVYERHHQALYRYCRSILRHDEDAQDALQSTFTRAFAALQDEQRDFELKPWLFRIAHNEAITILRRRPATGTLDELPAPGELEDRVSEREALRLLQMDLADLPERQRAALILRELNGLSHAEIGVVLELSTAAVKQAIFDARSALFSFRQGREMACEDIRRMLSDGDGRILRGRGVRAHLRSCSGCRRFQADLQTRPKALRALAPPLPIGGAAALLAQLLGGGATAAKLLACVAIAGGGTTLAVEMRHAREPAREAKAATPPPPKVVTRKQLPPKPPPKPAPIVAVASTPQPRSATPAPRRTTPKHPKQAKRKHHAHKRVHGRTRGKALGHFKHKLRHGRTFTPRPRVHARFKFKARPRAWGKARAPGQVKKHHGRGRHK
jgi:RNA polymerase sigma factor (sigma-70 family)